MRDAIEDLIQTAPPTSRHRFPVVWSNSYRSGLRQIADGERQGYSQIDQPMAHALLLCADGDFEAAEEFMLALLHDNLETQRKDGETFLSLLNGFFTVQRTDIVVALLAQRFTFADRLEIAFEDCAIGIGVMRWDISPNREHRFIFDAAALRSDATRLEILNLFWEFALFSNYAAQPQIEHGSVTLCRHDIASRPGLGYCGASPEIFLIPDGGFVPSKGYEWSRQVLAKNRLRWEDKRPVAFWRGATTGMKRNERDWRDLERVRLCELARRNRHTGLFDVGLSNVTQFNDPTIIQEIKDSGLLAGRVPWQDWGQYRYHIDIDGNSSPYSNLIQRLLTGSPVLKVESSRGLMQWFYSELIPWHNYVPISADMSDLVDKVQWLTRNDEFAQTVGRNGLAMIERMTIERELQRSVSVVDAAFRYFRNESAYILPYGMPARPTCFPAEDSGDAPVPAAAVQTVKPPVAPAMTSEPVLAATEAFPASQDPFVRKRQIETQFEKGGGPALEQEYLALLQSVTRVTGGIMDVRWPGVPMPLYLRCGTSDLASFTRVFARGAYGFAMEQAPRRIVEIGGGAGYSTVYLATRFPHADIVTSDPAADPGPILSLNTGGYARIRRLSVLAGGHADAPTAGGLAAYQAERPAIHKPFSIPDLLAAAGWDQVDLLLCDLEPAAAGALATAGEVIAEQVQCCAIRIPNTPLTGITEMISRITENDRFRHVKHGDLHVFARTRPAKPDDNAPLVSLLRPDQGVRPITLTNVRHEVWAYAMFGGDSCQLHPAAHGRPVPELKTTINLAGQTEFHTGLETVCPFGFGADFRVIVQSELDGAVIADATQSVPVGERLDWTVPLYHPASGPHEVTLQTVMTEPGRSNHQVSANWIAPHFR